MRVQFPYPGSEPVVPESVVVPRGRVPPRARSLHGPTRDFHGGDPRLRARQWCHWPAERHDGNNSASHLWRIHDRPRLYPACQRARLLPGPSGCPVARSVGADVDDPRITPCILRRAIGDFTQERKHSCHSVAWHQFPRGRTGPATRSCAPWPGSSARTGPTCRTGTGCRRRCWPT